MITPTKRTQGGSPRFRYKPFMTCVKRRAAGCRGRGNGSTCAGLAGGDKRTVSVAHYNWAIVHPSPGESPANDLEAAMAKGQMRSNKEKKKPKQDKNKKNAPPAPSPFAGMHSQAKPGTNPYGKKS